MKAILAVVLAVFLVTCAKPASRDDGTLADPPTTPSKPDHLFVPTPPPTQPARSKLDPDEAKEKEMVYRRALKLLDEQRNAEAIASLDECIRIDLYDASCYRALGAAHARLHHEAEALHAYKLYVVLEPRGPGAVEATRFIEEFDRPE